MIIALLVLSTPFAWAAVGMAGFAFWWTREFPLRGNLLEMAVLGGAMGPFAWLVGWRVHGRRSSARTSHGPAL